MQYIPVWMEYMIYILIVGYAILIPKLVYDLYKEIRRK